MFTQEELIQSVQSANYKKLAQCLSVIENNEKDWKGILKSFSFDQNVPIIGITGPPGAGKSTIISALIKKLSLTMKVAVLAVDPTSPFTQGSLLGDRVRMMSQHNNKNIYIRSLATRGALGGLSNKTLEMSDVLRASGFDIIIIETVGVGQSEVEIAALADTSVVVLVPESGDEVQMIKSGIIEIADIVVVNKADRPEAKRFRATVLENIKNKTNSSWSIPAIETIATKDEGIDELIEAIQSHQKAEMENQKTILLAQQLYHHISHHRMDDLSMKELVNEIDKARGKNGVNIYLLAEKYLK
ncbi:MAG: methylmalonyl Co-A mutase-associated GTPase MeaB [Bacteroidia bacterium]|nr:methylmalonyl Co-A mutase-associated GTPase MeaB [Bacteroidia bacterium]